MTDWSDGYVTDVPYTSNYYRQLAPGFLAFACLRQGVRPPALGPGATYLELGCGQGFGLNLLAAANPGMAFWGVDFLPGHIANAVRLAEAAGLSNVTFEDLSFEQLLALPDGRLPKFDVIALHGVYSWISAEARAAVVRILERLLKPGGLAYVSYNCLPGWAPRLPLQRFVAEYVARRPGDRQTRVVEALHAALAMVDGGAAYFKDVPSLRKRIEEALRERPAYLIHEFLNAHAIPLFHADVAREMAGARLTFAASAGVGEDQINLAAPAELQRQIFEAGDPIWRETLLDYASSKPFRRDIFLRGRNVLSVQERDAVLAETRFCLMAPADGGPFEFPIPIGVLTGEPAVYQAVVDALSDGPRTYGELAELPPFKDGSGGRLLKAVTLLVGGRRIHPAVTDDGGAEAAVRFNRALLARLDFEEPPRYLAAPLAGTGVAVEPAELAAIARGAEGEIDAARLALLRQLGAL